MKLTSFKTILRNVLGNVGSAAARSVGVDVAQWGGGAVASLSKGGKVIPLRTTIGNYARGAMEMYRTYKLGRDYAVADGATHWDGFKAGYDTLMRAARYHTSGIRDVTAIKKAHRSVFSSRLGKAFESVMNAALNLPDLALFYGEVSASLARQSEQAGVVVPTHEMYEQAYLEGQRSIFQDENALTRKVRETRDLLNFGKKFGLGSAIITYAKVPTNILREGMTWSPLGFLRSLYQGWRWRHGEETPHQIVQTILKAAAGTMALQPLGAWLFKLGILTAGWDDDKDKAALQRSSGWQAYAINWTILRARILSGNWHEPIERKNGDSFWSYGWLQPLAFSLAAGAERARAAKTRGDSPAWWTQNGFADGLKGGVMALADQPLVASLAMFARDIATDYQQGTPAHTMRVLVRTLDFVPAFLRDIRYMGNNTVPEARDANFVKAEIYRMIGGIPGVQLPARFNTLGEAEQRYQVAGNTWWNVLFNPFTVSRLQMTPAAAEAMRLAEATGNNAVIPTAINRTIQVRTNGRQPMQKMELSAAEISRMQQLTGKLTAAAHSLRLVSPSYVRMPDQYKAKMLADDVAGAQNLAKAVLFGHKLWSVSQFSGGVSVDKHAFALGIYGTQRGILTREQYGRLLQALGR